jgi:hypothetical protein
MDVRSIVNIIDAIEDENSIYLIEPISELAGFFLHQKCLLYVAKDIDGYTYEEIETEYLRLQTHVHISAVENDQTFEDGEYNIIVYKGRLTDNNIESFAQVCVAHANNTEELKFKDFFYSLISLFQLPSNQSYKNAIGLYGELKFMQFTVERFNHDISNSWHKRGSYSQYDFSNGEKSIEVKTTTSEQRTVEIKHQQIFGENPCWLANVVCEQYENGETIEEVIAAMHMDKRAFNSINFSINLAKELKRVSQNDVRDIRFRLNNIQLFDSQKVNPFDIVPDTVEKLQYRLDLSSAEEMKESLVNELISEF